jgi:Cof subfamily protein (haloacid dehalogenase superfamily)
MTDGSSPRLLALDLDGTILSPDLRLDQRDVDAVGRALRAGWDVVACTGRPYPGAVPWTRRIGLSGPIVCYQGAQVRAADGDMMLDHGVPHELAMEVVDLCRSRDLHVQAYRDDRMIVDRDRPEAQAYAHHAGMEVNVVGDLDVGMGPTTPKLVVVADEDVVNRLLPEFRERWEGRLNAATSMPTYLEMTSVAADKRSALEFLCRRIGVTAERAVAVGDGRNDVTMIAWAGVGYAVRGAAPEVVEAARGRTVGPPGTGGIAQMIAGLFDEERGLAADRPDGARS